MALLWGCEVNDYTAIDWGMANTLLNRGGATGRGTASSFKGTLQVAGRPERITLIDKSTLFDPGSGTLVPSGRFISEWLRDAGASRRPASNDNVADVCVPRFARVGTYRDAYYVDLKGAYNRLYSRLWWDVSYLPSKGGMPRAGAISLSEIGEMLRPHKHARNALVGFALSRHYTQWDCGRARVRRRPGFYFNPQLAWLLWSILGAVAWRVRAAGALYWNVDGAIVQGERLYDVLEVFDGLGLPWSEKQHGDCIVWGLGGYTFHDPATGRRRDGFPRGFGSSETRLPNLTLCEKALSFWREVAA